MAFSVPFIREGISKAIFREGLRFIVSESKINAIPNFNGTLISQFEPIPLPPLPRVILYFALYIIILIINIAIFGDLTAIRVTIPQVYALYTEPSTKKIYIIIENVNGDIFASRWPCLNGAQKIAIVANFRYLYRELWQLLLLGYFRSLGNILSLIRSSKPVKKHR